MKKIKTDIIHYGDTAELLNDHELFPSNSIDLIITSPPYADKREPLIKEKDYVEWFINISLNLLRVLNPQGSFILNIKEGIKNHERKTYVLELILALKQQGWYWLEEDIWYKTNAFPGAWKTHFRDGWERCLHFSKTTNINFYKESVRVPIGDWSKKRFDGDGYDHDKKIHHSNTDSGFSRKVSNWKNKKFVDPDNVLKLSTVSSNRNHNAVFPEKLPSWFIKLLSKKDNIVLDPFMGSGTTAIAAKNLGRKYIGIEIQKDNISLAKKRIENEVV